MSLNLFTIKLIELFDNAIPLYRVLSTDEKTENDNIFHLTTSNERNDRKGFKLLLKW